MAKTFNTIPAATISAMGMTNKDHAVRFVIKNGNGFTHIERIQYMENRMDSQVLHTVYWNSKRGEAEVFTI